ncbi:MAG: hypothetical protein CMJ75_11110 [Planctomycetaceae bacterium]|nr:hypothetical protein [Planctomycetaceae bacterium]
MKNTLGRQSIVGFVLALTVSVSLGADIPPVPADGSGSGDFIHDFAGMLSAQEMNQIGEHQQVAMEQHNTPIIVVTIRRMADYNHSGDIETFAKQWFNAWNIGTLDRDSGANLGALLLVSAGDRRARIELGADWGRKKDDYCLQVMNGRIVPSFKQGDFAGGITNGVISLKDMAAAGPDGSPPPIAQQSVPMGQRFQRSLRGGNGSSGSGSVGAFGFLPIALIALMVLGGMGLIVAGIFVPEYRKWLIGGGLLMIALGICFPIVVVLVLGFLGVRFGGGGGNSSGSYSSGGYSGGGYSGGYSGGGGASGSW